MLLNNLRYYMHTKKHKTNDTEVAIGVIFIEVRCKRQVSNRHTSGSLRTHKKGKCTSSDLSYYANSYRSHEGTSPGMSEATALKRNNGTSVVATMSARKVDNN